MRTSSAHLTDETEAERERLATFFGDLSPEQWDTPSLCEGWRVREVIAHLTMPARYDQDAFMEELELAIDESHARR